MAETFLPTTQDWEAAVTALLPHGYSIWGVQLERQFVDKIDTVVLHVVPDRREDIAWQVRLNVAYADYDQWGTPGFTRQILAPALSAWWRDVYEERHG